MLTLQISEKPVRLFEKLNHSIVETFDVTNAMITKCVFECALFFASACFFYPCILFVLDFRVVVSPRILVLPGFPPCSRWNIKFSHWLMLGRLIHSNDCLALLCRFICPVLMILDEPKQHSVL